MPELVTVLVLIALVPDTDSVVRPVTVSVTAFDAVDKGRVKLDDKVTLGKSDLTLFHQPIRDLILGARDIYLSSISNNLNRIMKTLTIITVIDLPLNIITGFFGMNFHAIPGLNSPTAFWITVAVMACAVTGMLLMFRKMRWL